MLLVEGFVSGRAADVTTVVFRADLVSSMRRSDRYSILTEAHERVLLPPE